jgi:hypothetical protein
MYQEEVKEEDLAVLINALKKQHEGLEHLMEIVRKDFRDVSIMKNDLFNEIK